MTASTQVETRLKGTPLSDGCTVARVCLFNDQRHRHLPVRRVAPANVDREIDRFRKAVDLADERLDTIRRLVETKVGRAEAGIFARNG